MAVTVIYDTTSSTASRLYRTTYCPPSNRLRTAE
jgi:hypothetical protein